MWDRFVTDSSAPGQYIFVAAQKDKAIELRNKIDNFKGRLMVELTIDIRVKQGLLFVSDLIVRIDWFVASDAMANDVESIRGGQSVIPIHSSWTHHFAWLSWTYFRR